MEMTYKVTAKTPKGNLTVEVEGESKFCCLDLAAHYFRTAFGEDVELWWKEVDDGRDDRLPRTYAEPEYTSEQLQSDPIAIEGAKWDDLNYQHYMER
jgi:hypothetical protein